MYAVIFFFAIFQAKNVIWVCNFIIYNTDYWIHSHSIFFHSVFFLAKKEKVSVVGYKKLGIDSWQ